MVENSTIKIRDTAGQSLMYKSFVCKMKIKVENCGTRIHYRIPTNNCLCVFFMFKIRLQSMKVGVLICMCECVYCLCVWVCVWFVWGLFVWAPEITWFDKKSIFAIFQNHIRKFEFCLEWIIPCYFAIGRP